MDALNGICVSAPVKIGDVIVPNIAGTGANLVATKNMVGSTHTQVAAGG